MLRFFTLTVVRSGALLLCCLLLASGLSGQTRLSPKFGLNFSALESELELQQEKREGRAGWNAGLDVRLESGKVFLQPGLHFQSINTRLSKINAISQETIEGDSRISSLKLPVLAGFYLSDPSSLLRLHLKAGLTPEYVLSIDEAPELGFTKNDIKDFPVSFTGGIGFDFALFTINARLDYGITDYFEDANDRNHMIVLDFGFIF